MIVRNLKGYDVMQTQFIQGFKRCPIIFFFKEISHFQAS